MIYWAVDEVKIKEFLPDNTIDVYIEKGKELDERIVTISGRGERFESIVKELNIN